MSIRSQDPSPGSDAFGLSESASVIDRHSTFDGTYSTDRDLRIEGTVKGKLSCQGTLHVAQGATVNAEIEAEQVVIAGSLEGAVICRTRLQIMPSGELKGKISTPSLVINEGARYEGSMEMPSHSRRIGPARNQPALGGGSADDASEESPETNAESRRNPGGGSFIRRIDRQEGRRAAEETPTQRDSSEAVNES